ncbi:hypothetical protein vBYenM281_048 [Yersinia phage vB_YenM_281]|nr:hypothetical protein vBYenM281_048 [Yersinia phage vB_YenM_281]
MLRGFSAFVAIIQLNHKVARRGMSEVYLIFNYFTSKTCVRTESSPYG